jgi:hypothetical protein
VRSALSLVLLFAFAAAATAQTPSRGKLPTDGRVSYSRDDRIHIPFDLKNDGPATKVVLYSSFNDGPWEEAETARPGQKRGFIFKADREGSYAFATMTHFASGRTDPERKDQLKEQKVVVFDKTPPKVYSIRAVTSNAGAPGVEWEVTDDFMDPKGIKLQFRWDRTETFRPIEQNLPFSPRDTMYWQLKPDDRMQVRLIATDWAGNRTESEPVWVSGKDGERGGDPTHRTPAAGTSGMRDAVVPAPGARAIQPTLHYLNTQSVALKLNAEVGASGLTKATLYWADEKLEWKPHKDIKGPMAAPDTNSPDKVRIIPVDFNFQAEKDGLYNFIIVVENHWIASRKVPAKGEPGDIQVMVDTTKPAVRFIDPPKATAKNDRSVVVNISWEAKDANIAPVPIKLEYSAVRRDRPGEMGEWKAITPDWMDNIGQYTWLAPTGESHLFMIRVTCKDRAGNEGKVETVTPVNVDLEVPKVQGVDVAPGKGGLGPAPGAPGVPGYEIAPGPGPKK